MANTIVVKHRSANIGEPSDLLAGEIAANINPASKKLFIGTGSGNVVFADQTYVDTGFQPLNANLTDIAALTQRAGDLIRSNGTDFITLKNNISGTAAPTATDDTGAGYSIGSMWLDTTNDKAYIALDVTSTAAVWVDISSTGEANTASNVGTAGVGIFKQKSSLDLEFKKINAGSNKISITDDTGNDEIDIDVNQANLSITESQISDLQAYLTSETSHADVLVDSDFTSSGLMTTNGSGTYSITTLDTSTSLGTSDTTVPPQNAVKSYVDTAVAGGVNYQGGYNATTNTPDLDTSPSSILKGYMYTVTAAVPGNNEFFGTIGLEVGDVLISEVDSPSTAADWTIVQRNIIDDSLIDGGTF